MTKHERGGSMACPVLFRRDLILLKSLGRVWEAHDAWMQTDAIRRSFNIVWNQFSYAELWQEEQKYLQKATCSPCE